MSTGRNTPTADVPDAPQVGSLFADKYRVDRLIGIGGMGYVLAATHVHLDEPVAIKLLLPAARGHAETVQRFLREGRAAVKIRSEHVARVLDVAVTDGTPYMVLELLEGRDLSQLIEELRVLPVAVAVDYVLEACEALAEAHALLTVHRDLKPSNLFLARLPDGRDCVKVLDFGISKTVASQGNDLAMTSTAASMGSPLYMSPEQLLSAKAVDARADIWALGIILFELVSGRVPFAAAGLAELGALVLATDAPDVRTFAPEVPAGLALVVATCLRRDPLYRFPSCAELAAALAPFGTASAEASLRIITKALENTPRPASHWCSATHTAAPVVDAPIPAHGSPAPGAEPPTSHRLGDRRARGSAFGGRRGSGRWLGTSAGFARAVRGRTLELRSGRACDRRIRARQPRAVRLPLGRACQRRGQVSSCGDARRCRRQHPSHEPSATRPRRTQRTAVG